MSDRPIDQDVGPSRDFVPEVNALEARNLPSAVIPRGDSIVWHPNPPRTGGIAVQSGSVLSCFVGQTRENVVQVTDDGKGDVAMSWNFGQPHSFHGVATSIIQAQRARTDQITFNLNAPRTSPVAVAVGSLLVADVHTRAGAVTP